MTLRSIFIFSLFLCSFCLPVYSQKGDISLQGTTVDDNGAIVVGAKVRVLSGKHLIASRVTDEDGKFKINGMPPGKYTLIVSSANFITRPRQSVTLDIVGIKEIIITFSDKCLGSTKYYRPSDLDRKIILESVLNALLGANRPPLIEVTKGERLVVSLSEFEGKNLLTTFGKRLEFLTESQIQERADRLGDFRVLRFERINFIGPCALVSAGIGKTFSKRSTSIGLDGALFNFEYRIQGRKWIGKLKNTWISIRRFNQNLREASSSSNTLTALPDS